ncbi:MAG: Hsp20/alpha crystallin family protein [Myxococcales bacterium]|nr:Hsp20/alpha crystallin family protein [Myxococcales bacterium]
MSTEIQRPENPVRVIHPPVDAFEDDDGLLLRADLPGVSRDGLTIELDNGVLTLTGRRPLPAHRGEGFVQYHRRFYVPRHTDGEKVRARLDHGVLTIELPKADAAKPRRIPIGG